MRNPIYAAFLVTFSFVAACGVGPAQEEPADMVFTNGMVYTVDDANPQTEAVAVRGNEVVYVGDDAGAEALVGEGTERIDLDTSPIGAGPTTETERTDPTPATSNDGSIDRSGRPTRFANHFLEAPQVKAQRTMQTLLGAINAMQLKEY